MLDTSVLISAIRSETGAAAEVIRQAILGRVQLLMDFKLSCEYREVALRAEHVAASGSSGLNIERLIDEIEAIATPVLVDARYRPLSSDPKDDMVLDVAINGQTDAILTNNLKHFESAASQFGILVFTPKDFLIRLKQGGHTHAG